MYVYIYIYMCVYIYICLYMYAFICIYIDIYKYIHTYADKMLLNKIDLVTPEYLEMVFGLQGFRFRVHPEIDLASGFRV